VPFNNKSREKAITIYTAHIRPMRLKCQSAVQGTTANTPKSRLARRRDGEDSKIASTFPNRAAPRPQGFVEKTGSVSMLIAFLRFSIHRDSMGQQLRVQIKRKRRRAYLQRKKASQRAATKRPVLAKQQAHKESVAAE
jgi:hypothetical protein